MRSRKSTTVRVLSWFMGMSSRAHAAWGLVFVFTFRVAACVHDSGYKA